MLTAGFAQPLWHLARASSSSMLLNTVLTQRQLGMAELGFKCAILWLDIWSSFDLHFLSAQFSTAADRYDRPTAIVSKVGAEAQIACKSSFKPQQPQPFSNISLPLAQDYSACKERHVFHQII